MKSLFIAAIILFCLRARAAEWYVDAGVDNPGNGQSWATAWKNTDDIVWASVVSGDTIWFRPGRYARLFIKNKQGITVKIEPGATAPAIFQGPLESVIHASQDIVVDGRVGSRKLFHFPGRAEPYLEAEEIVAMFTIRASQRVQIKGFYIDRERLWSREMPNVDGVLKAVPHTLGIYIANNSGANDDILVEDCEVRFMTKDGIRIPKTPLQAAAWDNFIIRRCRIVNTGQDGISFGAHGVTFENCHVDRNNQTTPLGSHMDGLQAIPRAKYIRVRNNFFSGWPMNIFIERSAGPVEIYNNIAVGRTLSDRCRALSASPSEYPDAPFEGHWLVANNTFVDIWNFPAYLGAGSVKRVVPPDKLFVGNNIFLNCKEMYPSKSHFGKDFDNSSDLYFNTTGVRYYKFENDRSNTAVGIPKNQNAFKAVYADPLLNNPSGNDFRLRKGSPAIRSGKNFSRFFTTDFDGNPRPAAPSAWDIGALVYKGGDIGAATPGRP